MKKFTLLDESVHTTVSDNTIPLPQKEEAKTVEGKKLLKYEFEVIDGKLHCISHTQNVTFEEVHEALIMVKDHIDRHIAKRHECPFYNPNNAGIDGRFKR